MRQLWESSGTKADKIPDGFFTREQFQKQWNCGPTAAKRRIKKLVEDGVLSMRIFKIPGVDGRPYEKPHYGPPTGGQVY